MNPILSPRFCGSLLGFLFFWTAALAQNPAVDSTDTEATLPPLDTTELTEVFGEEVPMQWGEPYTPLKAGMLSAALPGLGQVYNGKAWKVALIYAAFGGTGYMAYYWHDRYVYYRGNLFAIIDVDPLTKPDQPLSEETLRSFTNTARRQRDVFYIAIAGVYLLNIAEANIDAHLRNFNLDDDLAARTGIEVKPLVVAEPNYTGVGVRFVLP